MPSLISFALTALAAAEIAQSTYTLSDSFEGSSFFDTFNFFTETDPTAGFVEYVDSSTAIKNELIGLVNGTGDSSSVYLGADFKSKTTTGRQSVRIMSQQSWTHGLFIADINALPSVCSGWPSLWFLNPTGPWPTGGEIDMIEVSSPSPQNPVGNQITLHTDAGCAVKNASTSFSGQLLTSDCDVNDQSQPTNAGCGVLTPLNNTLTVDNQTCTHSTAGPGFNTQGGGVYAMLWTSESLTFWFYPRDYVPADITSGTPTPSTWTAKPVAKFEGCDFDAHIKNLSVVINLTFCGAWANSTYTSNCAADTGVPTCDAFVGENPGAFKNAYWLINSLKMYQDASAPSTSRLLRRDGTITPSTLEIPVIDLNARNADDHHNNGSLVEKRRLVLPDFNHLDPFTSGAPISLHAGLETEGGSVIRGLALAGCLLAIFFAALV